MRKELYYQRKGQKLCVQCGALASDGIYCDVCRIAREDNTDMREISKRYKERYEGNKTLDDDAAEAHEKHLTYGQLQAMRTIERLRREK